MAQKAVLFDMDGVVIDNLPYHVDAWLLYCERHGIHLTREIFYKDLNGLNSKDTFEWLLKRKISQEEINEYAYDIIKLLGDSETPMRCRALAEKYFSMDVGASKYLDLYSKMLHAKV